jgi:nitroreductase
MIEKPAITEQPIAKIIAERWSGRAYDATMPVSNEQLIALVEAARWAPSCFGEEPWRFLVCNRATHADSWEKVFDSLAPGNQEWAQNAPLLIVAAASNTFSHNGKANKWASYDTGAASINLCLQASELGLMSHQMGGFDADVIRENFNIGEEITIWSVIAIGHPAPLDDLSTEQIERELKARERSPISENFFMGEWSS